MNGTNGQESWLLNKERASYKNKSDPRNNLVKETQLCPPHFDSEIKTTAEISYYHVFRTFLRLYIINC
jgi:hypothetical protein